MSKYLMKFSILFFTIYASNIFIDPCISSTPLQMNTQGNNSFSVPIEAPIPTPEKSANSGQIRNIPVMPNGMNVNDIQADSVVAITSGSADEAPQVFFSEKGSVPFKGWVYITTGAEYLNLINSNEGQYQTNNYYQQYPQPETSQLVQVTPPGVLYQQQGVGNQQTVPPQQTNYYQRALPQPTQQVVQPSLQNTEFTQPSTQMGQLIPDKTAVVAQEVQSGRKIEQGEIDDETPEVLISDGAVYKLANSVKITDNGNNNSQSPVSANIPQQSVQNVAIGQPGQAPQQIQGIHPPLIRSPLNMNQSVPAQVPGKIQHVIQNQDLQNAQPVVNTSQNNNGTNQNAKILDKVPLVQNNGNNNSVNTTDNLNGGQSINTNNPLLQNKSNTDILGNNQKRKVYKIRRR